MCLPIIGGIVSGVGAAIGAMQTAASYKAQAQARERQARIEEKIGAHEADKQADTVKRVSGRMRANYTASGVALEGSALDIIDETAREGAMDVEAIRTTAGMKADTLRYEAQISRMNAKGARASAPFAFLSPVLQGAARMSSQYATA